MSGKRRELEFFTAAASSFKPRPYTPVKLNPRRHINSHPPPMDPHPSDPNVLFIHPPFNSFPNSHLHPDGLTFQLMTENPNWFLDPHSFISSTNIISYPPQLEPPRGWCPAKKKDLKDRGSEGWPDGEEPRLRCTFCRRTYAGVNAKSMWRRHIFEKHNIPMSNRRDGSDRPRGRGSNKENSHVVPRPRLQSHDSLVNLDIASQTDSLNVSHKSKFRSLFSATGEPRNRRNSVKERRHNTFPLSAAPQSDSPQDERETHHSPTHALPLSPPLTPQSSTSPDPIRASFEPPTQLSTPLPVVPPSPYDPLLTPSFRHSPPRLPSDQPWRFPSPSHPLHSRARELSLSMLIREVNSPVMKGLPVLGASPGMAQSPPAPLSRVLKAERNIFEVDTPESVAKSLHTSPRAFFPDQSLTPLGIRIFSTKTRHQIAESPLHRSSTPAARDRAPSESADNWLSEASLMSSSSSLGTSELLTSGDPFVTMYSSWGPIAHCEHDKPQELPSSPPSGPENDSPVLRNAALPRGVGLGIGLLGPFSLPKDTQSPVTETVIDVGGDFTDMLTCPLLEEEGDKTTSSTVADNNKANCHATSPPKKKRRMTVDNLD